MYFFIKQNISFQNTICETININGGNVEKIYCPHCENELNTEIIDTKNCPWCDGTIKRFTISSFTEKNIHLFEIIGIFGAIAILMPTVTLGLKELFNMTPNDSQVGVLGVSIFFFVMLVSMFWLLIIYNVIEERKLSPVRRFLKFSMIKDLAIRQGDPQFYLFLFFFAPIYILLISYILNLSYILTFIFIGIPMTLIALISEIFDYLCKSSK